MTAVSRAEAEEHLRLWIETLRTTTDEQSTGLLARQEAEEDTVGYCCLGIGCKIAGIAHVKSEPVEDGEVEVHHYFDGCDELAPPAFVEWLGFETGEKGNSGVGFDLQLAVPDARNMSVSDRPDMWRDRKGTPLRNLLSAAEMNDSLHLTFPQIADCVAYFGIEGTA